MKLEFHPEAELELIEAALYYEREVHGLGERLEEEVRRATARAFARLRPAPGRLVGFQFQRGRRIRIAGADGCGQPGGTA